MAQTTFEFINVLHPNKVKDFTDLFTLHCKQECCSWYWYRFRDGRTKNTLSIFGKMTFKVKRTLHEVKLWFRLFLENTLCEHLSVKMVNGHEDGIHTDAHKPPPDFLKCKPRPDFLKCKVYKKYGWKI